MPRTRPSWTAFNAGELSPLLDGRVDQDKYFTGCKTLSNFIPTVQGPVRRRGGTRFVAKVKDSTKRTWLADFIFSVGQAYVMEFGDKYLRLFTNRGQLLSGGVPYEIVTPYSEADLVTAEGTFALRTLQSKDVMWIVHAEGKHPPYRLSRLGATNWTLAPEVIFGGPFRATNTDGSKWMQSSGVTGTVTVTSNYPYFVPGHVGAYVQLKSQNPATVSPFQQSATYSIGDRIRNEGSVYERVADPPGVTTGTQRYVPTHTEGDAYDGKYTWRYLHSGSGYGKITAVAVDGLSCTVEVKERFPDEVVSANTTRWAFSEFSTVFGWPTDIAFFRERLVYSRGVTLFMSVTGDFSNFARQDAGLVTKETGLQLTLTDDKLDDIRWMVQSTTLMLGSARSELSLSEQTSQSVFAADNVKSSPQTDYGARMLRPLKVADSILFVERAGHRVRDARYSFETDKYKAEDITVLSEHIFDGSEITGDVEQEPREIIDWAYQQQRDSVVWCILSDGTAAALVLNRERGVIAWAPQYFGGDAVIEAVRAIPSPDRRTDDAWFIVRRTINGQTVRTVEYMTDFRLVKGGAAEAVHVDCSVTKRAGGAGFTEVEGLDHLEGEWVQICADGSVHPKQRVTGGKVTLNRPTTLAHVGLGYVSRLQTMRLEIQGGGGTGQTAAKGLSEMFLLLQSTVGGRVGASFDKMDPIKATALQQPAGAPPLTYSGYYKLQFPAGYKEHIYVCFEQADPLPATIVALVSRAQIND